MPGYLDANQLLENTHYHTTHDNKEDEEGGNSGRMRTTEELEDAERQIEQVQYICIFNGEDVYSDNNKESWQAYDALSLLLFVMLLKWVPVKKEKQSI